MKKAQGFNAAILVAVIAGLIIIYMLFLPAQEREDLLEGREAKKTVAGEEEEYIILLEEGVGRLDPATKADDRTIPNVYLFEMTNSKVLATLNPVYVRNGVFDKKVKTVPFSIDTLEDTDNIMLTFTAPTRKGVLTIKLNDNIIYEYKVSSLNVEPIKISKNLLAAENTLEFSVSGVGIRFWATNEYSLENIKIIGDITDKSRQESRNIFSLTETEYQNLDSAELRFIPYCSLAAAIGVLDVYVNNQNIYSAIPVCDDPVRINVPIGVLSAGANKVIFKTSRGSYSIEQIIVNLESKETISNVYYFDVNSTVYDSVVDEGKNADLIVEFVDDLERKRADLNVNGHLYRIDQYEDVFTKNINNWIEEDNNFIKLTPVSALDIVELRVEVEE